MKNARGEGFMKIKFLGTAAAEGWPAIFCQCEHCMKARRIGGKNIRTRSSCLIDEKYMVDFPPDTYMHVLNNKLDLFKVEHLIITHSHEDHFYPQDIHTRKEPYAHINGGQPLTVYGNNNVREGYYAADVEKDNGNRLAFKEVYPYRQFQAGEAQVTPLLADHKKGEQCFIYTIKLGGKTLLYGHDTGYFPEETWQALSGVHIDAAILDCTAGPMESDTYHMGFPAVLKVRERLVNTGSADKDTVFIITHFSHNCGLLHEELVDMASPYGFITAFDGMELKI